jgi:hypothetical protein
LSSSFDCSSCKADVIMVIVSPNLMPLEGEVLSDPASSNSNELGHTETETPMVSPMFCDKFSIVCKLSPSLVAEAAANLDKLIEEGLANRQYSKRYRHEALIHPSSMPWMGTAFPGAACLSLDAKIAGVSDFRLELNPSKANVLGLAEVLSFLAPDLPPILLEKGRVKRVDVAVDVAPLSFADVGIHVSGQQLSSAHWGGDGVLETGYWGANKGFCVYDKLRERHPVHEVPKDGPAPTTLRFEARLKPDTAFHSLEVLANPFERIVVAAWVGFSDTSDSECWWLPMFLDSVRQRGTTAALKLLPQTQRKFIARRLEKCRVDFWDPATIWERWPIVVQHLHMLTSPAHSLPVHELQSKAAW